MSDEISGVKEPTFKIYASNNVDTLISQDKVDILKHAKEDAMMIKHASFREGLQDPYPSPFLNLSDMNIPRKAIDIFKWCRYFYMFDPLIAGAINSLATFPVTDVYLEDNEENNDAKKDSPALTLYKKLFFKTINIHKLLIEIGIDYWLYGNCFIFGEMGDGDDGEKEWKSIIRLDPSKMIIDVNQVTQVKSYKWQVPDKIARIVRTKSPRAEYDRLPQMILDAVREKKSLVIKASNIYHFQRPSDSMGDSAWGTPVVANVLKLLMYRNILRQAQEAIAREHVVPFRVYYFEKTDNYNTQIDWTKVASDFAGELSKSARDPNHKVISPVPVQVLNIGGDGKSLMLTPEIEQIQSEILAGMGIPREFIFGGVSYSGSSISLRILENQFITYRLLLKEFMNGFLIRNQAKARGEWVSEKDDASLVTAKMSDLKMQDDVQQKQLVVNLNAAGKLSDEYLWKTLEVNPEKMREAIRKEALMKIEQDAELQIAQLKASLPIQKLQLEIQVQLQVYQQELMTKYNIQPQVMPGGDPSDPNAQGGDPSGGPSDPNAQGGDPSGGPQGSGAVQGLPMQPQAGGQPQGSGQPQAGVPNASPQVAPVIDVKSIVQKLSQMDPAAAKKQMSTLSPQIQAEVKSAMSQNSNARYQGQGYGEAQAVALKLLHASPEQRQMLMKDMPQGLRDKVTAMVMHAQQQDDDGKQDASSKTDMRKMPEQRPPRRDSLK